MFGRHVMMAEDCFLILDVFLPKKQKNAFINSAIIPLKK